MGGACDTTFSANTFEEMADLSKAHGMKMYEAGDEAHITAMNKMMELMNAPEAMVEWFDAKREAFEALAED